MKRLHDLLGREHASDSLNRRLRDFAQSRRAAAVGALHVTCADECERETVESFQHWFVDSLLPELKFSDRAPFRLANLGGRYEWGAVAIAEQHFATPATCDNFKLIVVKLNSHVSVTGRHGQLKFGSMDRYSAKSVFCGAMHGLLDGNSGPAYDELLEVFASENKPRLEMLRDPQAVDPGVRSLLAAVVNARLQARRAVIDIQHHRPHSPTYYLVLACVTLNRPQRDSELVVGLYTADCRSDPFAVHYRGLGDDPSRYQVCYDHSHLVISDQELGQHRPARDHREEILNTWMQRREREAAAAVRDERFDAVVRRIHQQNGDPQVYLEILKTMGWLMLDLSPVPTSILLFAKGAAGAHHLYRVHRLARGEGDRETAEPIVREFLSQLDELSPEQARAIVESLLAQHRVVAPGGLS